MFASLPCFSCQINFEFEFVGPTVENLNTDEFNNYVLGLTCKCDNCFNNRMEEINKFMVERAQAKAQGQKPKVLVKRRG